MKSYKAFLKSKVRLAKPCGVTIEPGAVNAALKPHQAASAQWMVAGGRRAAFMAFGLGKTLIQLETLRLIVEAEGGRALIVAPLGVRQEFVRDAMELLGWKRGPKFIRSIEETQREDVAPGGCLPYEPGDAIYLTNYETVRDGKLDPRHFTAVSLDEASCLRGFGSTKTFREFMRLFDGVRFKFVATATPSPNEYIELLAYAAFLEVMDVGEAKTRFFKRDSTKADKLTLHPHKEEEFWLWVASWALFVQRPSDLGFDDEGYQLPELKVTWHEVASDHSGAGTDKSGQGKLLRDAAIGVQDASA